MGTSFSIDTPAKVAQYGIDSVIQIMDDQLCEHMRAHYANIYQLPYTPIAHSEWDYRAKRISAYLDLLDLIVQIQLNTIKSQPIKNNKYFEMLPETSPVKMAYETYLKSQDPKLEDYLKSMIKSGSIDVNIMTVVDRDNYDNNGQKLPDEYSDALSALRGFANSTVASGVVLSAGFNRRLNTYMEQFDGFYPDEAGFIKKRVILKVSDYRSAMIQGKLFAKKGIWISEFRIESGLNCGGHAFASDGFLMGPILDEFKNNREEMYATLLSMCNETLRKREKTQFSINPPMRVTVQGGIGTTAEDQFLLKYYQIDGTGWASPFLLVPEASLVDDETRELLAKSGPNDVYLSPLSPLGVPFNAVRNTISDQVRSQQIKDGHPGSPCRKRHLCFNTEFGGKPLCTASSVYQKKKIAELDQLNLPQEAYQKAFDKITQKACLCEDLGAGAYIAYHIPCKSPLTPVICPGPNIAYFSKIVSLAEMIGHIYGRLNLLNTTEQRPHMFIKELKMYIDYFKEEISNSLPKLTEKQAKKFEEFKTNLFNGIEYYKTIIPKLIDETNKNIMTELNTLKSELDFLVQQKLNPVIA